MTRLEKILYLISMILFVIGMIIIGIKLNEKQTCTCKIVSDTNIIKVETKEDGTVEVDVNE